MVNGQKVFADPTVFTAKNGSLFKHEQKGFTILKNNSSYIAESGSLLELNDKSVFVVDSGCTLQIKAGAGAAVKGSGRIIIKSGGYLCVEQGADINLQDYNSVIALEEGAVLGADPQLFPNASCSSAVLKTGNGSIADYSQDVYIQNETISADRYIAGRNIFVGNNVTAGKPSGNVLINNGAGVIFDCREIVLDAGFECAAGASFEVKNH